MTVIIVCTKYRVTCDNFSIYNHGSCLGRINIKHIPVMNANTNRGTIQD